MAAQAASQEFNTRTAAFEHSSRLQVPVFGVLLESVSGNYWP